MKGYIHVEQPQKTKTPVPIRTMGRIIVNCGFQFPHIIKFDTFTDEEAQP